MKRFLIIIPLVLLCNCRIGLYIHKKESKVSINPDTKERWVEEKVTEEIRIKIKKAQIEDLTE